MNATEFNQENLDLILLNIPNISDQDDRSQKRIAEYFEPAITSGLLKINQIDLTEDDIKS